MKKLEKKINKINKKIKKYNFKKEKIKDKIGILKTKRYEIQSDIDIYKLREMKNEKVD